MITKEEWDEWREHPVTQEYYAFLKENRDRHLQALHGLDTIENYRFVDGYYSCLLELTEGWKTIGT